MSIPRITIQPPPLPTPEFNEKLLQVGSQDTSPSPQLHGRRDCESCSQCGSGSPTHNRCHNSRLRRFMIPLLVVIFTLAALMTISCVGGHDFFSGWQYDPDSLVRRAVDPNTGATTGGVFTDRKLYLIIIFVGLFVVVILGIMLSAWCCKGAFRNPLCCPCYLCACCGGLACLECIGCGLCAEGFQEM